MVQAVERSPGLTVQIFSGTGAGNLARALAGETLGTLITT
jgi:isopentenyl phosphate kinase